MDIYQFIDSRDIRNYLQDIKYKFTVPETAFLIYMSRRATLNEKLDAWQEIIDTMPDCSMGERINMVEIPSFCKFLTEYIALLKKLLDIFTNRKKRYIPIRFMRKRETGSDLSGSLNGWKKEKFFRIIRRHSLI